MNFSRSLKLLLLWAGLAGISASGQTWDAKAGLKASYSTEQNPNGQWCFGWSTTLGGPLTVFPNFNSNANGAEWIDLSILVSGDPAICYNETTGYVGVLPPDTISIHPGATQLTLTWGA